MPIGNTTSAIIDPVIRDYYDGMALMRALPRLLHGKFGQMRPIDQKSGDRAIFRRYNSVDTALTRAPLIEMTTPSPVQITKTDLTATLEQYGAYCKYSDKVDYTTQDPQIAEKSAVMGENEGQTLDLVFRDKLLATTSEYLANAVATRVLVATKALGTDFDKIARVLHKANAESFDPNIIKASTGVGTAPVRAAFYVIVEPDVQYDIDNTTNFPGFIPVANYPNPASALPGEFGAYKEFRFVSTTHASILAGLGAAVAATGLKSTGGFIDVYQCLIFAQNAYGVVPLNGRSHETLVTRLEASHANPLALFGTIGWKSMQTLALLNETFMLRYECGATA